MLSKKIKRSKTNTQQHMLSNLSEYIIKIDYFDKTGTKNFEDNIPLEYIVNSHITLAQSNIES